MTRKLFPVLLIIAAALVIAVTSSHDALGDPPAKGGIQTLYFRDAQLASFSFTLGTYGRSHRDSDVTDSNIDLDASWLNQGNFTIACHSKDRGKIQDLGDAKIVDGGVGVKEGIVEVRGKSYSIYHSLVIKEGKLQQKFAPFTNRWKILFDDLGEIYLSGQSFETAPILNGHVYLMRITDTQGKEKLFVKLRVLEYEPNDHVVFRWDRLN